jgi:hypothetical protein
MGAGRREDAETRLRRARAFAARYVGGRKDDQPLYPRFLRALATTVDDDDSIVLLAHSGAGPLMAAAASRISRVTGIVFVDAGLPSRVTTWSDGAPANLTARLRASSTEGLLPPWSTWFGAEVLLRLLPDPVERARLLVDEPRLPVSILDEPLPTDALPADVPAAYLHLGAAYDSELAEAQRRDWPTRSTNLGHLGLLCAPERVAASIAELLEAMKVRDRIGA